MPPMRLSESQRAALPRRYSRRAATHSFAFSRTYSCRHGRSLSVRPPARSRAVFWIPGLQSRAFGSQADGKLR